MSRRFEPANTNVNRQALDRVLATYGVGAMHRAPIREGGAVNQVYRVETDDGTLILRIHQPGTLPDRLEAVHRIQDRLRIEGLPLPRIHRTQAGASWVDLGGRLVEVLRYVPGGREVSTLPDGLVLCACLGRFHAAVRMVGVAELPPPVNPCTASPATALELLQATQNGFSVLSCVPGYGEAVAVQHAAHDVLRQLHTAWQAYAGTLPELLVHGDFVGNNVLLTDRRVVAILDFDRLMKRPRIEDLATTLTYVLTRLIRTGQRLPSANGSLSQRDISYVADLIDAYTRASGWALTRSEGRTLPYELARTPLYPIAAAGRDLHPARVPETLDFGGHVPLCGWLVAHATRVSDAWTR